MTDAFSVQRDRPERGKSMSSVRLHVSFVFLVVVLFVPTFLHAQPLEFALAGINNQCRYFLSCPSRSWVWQGTPGYFEYDTDVVTLAARGNGVVIAATDIGKSARASLVRLFPDGSRKTISTFPPGVSVGPLVSDRAFNTYVLTYAPSGAAITTVNDGGVVTDTMPVAGPIGWNPALDLAANQCTLYLTAEQSIKRLDVCSRTSAADLASLPFTSDVRVLSDGTVLAALQNGELRRLDSSGSTVRSYMLPAGEWATAIGVESIDSVVVSTQHVSDVRVVGTLFRLNLVNGVVTGPIGYTSIESARSLVLYRGFTAALGPTAPVAEIPAASKWALLGLACVLGLLGLLRIS